MYNSAGYPRPDDIWIADWTGDPVLTDSFVPAGDWPGHRLHQYYGGHNETWSGDTVNVDDDVIGGTVAGRQHQGGDRRPDGPAQPLRTDRDPAERGSDAGLHLAAHAEMPGLPVRPGAVTDRLILATAS